MEIPDEKMEDISGDLIVYENMKKELPGILFDAKTVPFFRLKWCFQ